MNLSNNYWFFKKALSDTVCDDIIKYGNQQQDESALVGNEDSLTENKDLKKKRNSNIVWLNDPWIYNEIHPYIHIANKNAGWNFEWDWSESCQFTKYKLNQYYGWHCDSWNSPYNKKDLNIDGKIRKLSVTVSLSNSKDYEGGELEFDFRNKDPEKKRNIVTCEEIVERGSIVVFPSHLWHRVQPVTKGIRYSLVIWSLGQPFK
tara:strand:- start:171 stop:782 length:612 start_codon:yes stop_codon:yes gene_type:complete